MIRVQHLHPASEQLGHLGQLLDRRDRDRSSPGPRPCRRSRRARRPARSGRAEPVEPVLSYTEISGRRIMRPRSGSARPAAAAGARRPGRALSTTPRRRLAAPAPGSAAITAAVDAAVDVVHRRRGLGHARREHVVDGCGPGTSGSGAESVLTTRPGKRSRKQRRSRCSTPRRPRGRRRARSASRPSRRRAPPGPGSRRARRRRSRSRPPRARSARARPSRLLATAAIGRPASISACRFVPSPLTSTPITPASLSRFRRRVSLGHDRAHPDPEVEDAVLLLLLDACSSSQAKTAGRSHEFQSISGVRLPAARARGCRRSRRR